MTCELAATENEIKAEGGRTKNGHGEPDEMKRVLAEMEEEEQQKMKEKAMERLVSQGVREAERGGRAE